MSDIPPVEAIQLNWPVNFRGEERYITGISRGPVEPWVTIDGSIDQMRLDELEWIRECFWSDAGEPARKVKLW